MNQSEFNQQVAALNLRVEQSLPEWNARLADIDKRLQALESRRNDLIAFAKSPAFRLECSQEAETAAREWTISMFRKFGGR